jgi:spermidine synthase
MKVQQKLAETETPDGARLTLHEHDGAYAIRMNGQGLMSSTATESELVLGQLGTAHISGQPDAAVLIGGLGLGFTLKSVLEHVAPTATVHVAELLPAVVEWNREFLPGLNGKLLDDPRVKVYIEDVLPIIRRAATAQYGSILLDIDNGPSAMVQDENARLYSDAGLQAISAALKRGGRAVIWSAGEDEAFCRRLRKAGFKVNLVRAKRYTGARRAAIFLYVAEKGTGG